jgi:thioredoxin reductase/bacterioferritin-associated ferredoxin
MNKKYDTIIIGSGLAGLNAANILSEHNIKTAIIDENHFSGGQYLRKLPDTFNSNLIKYTTKVKKNGLNLLKKLHKADIDFYQDSTVIGVYDNNRVLFEKGGKAEMIVGETLIIATGAREKYLPFKGWTLPGVLSAGALQVFLKSNGVLPAEKILIAGTGPFLYAVAYETLVAGGKVQGIYELNGFFKQLPFGFGLMRAPSKIFEALVYMEEILRKWTKIKYGWKIIKAEGAGKLERVILAKTNPKGDIIKGSEKTIKTELLATGFGFIPNIELINMIGGKTEYRKELGGWIIKVTDELETTIEGVFSAGETTGIGGAEKSVIEGKLAGYSILKKLEKIDKDFSLKIINKLKNKRKNYLKYAEYLNSVYSVDDIHYKSIDDKTIICRCEDVSLKEIKEAYNSGFKSLNSLKIFTRSGMGNCQGRTCGPIITEIIKTYENGKIPEQFKIRKPAKPVNISSLVRFYEEKIKS